MQPDAKQAKPKEQRVKTLYKYRATSDRTEDIITKKSIWLARPDTLNDPLECQIKPLTPQELKKHARDVKAAQASGFIMNIFMTKKSGSSFYGRTGKQLKYLLNRIKSAKSFDKKYQIMCDFYQEVGVAGFSSPDGYFNSLSKLLNGVGIFSLTENPANTLMWSHYGDSHRGIAVGFDAVDGSDLADAEKCQQVTYSDELSEFSFEKGFSASTTFYANDKPKSSISFNDDQVRRAFFSKTNDWAYEKEWRYIRQVAGSYDLPAPITEVVFGAKCPAEIRDKYRAIVSVSLDKEVRFREAVFLPGTTAIEIKDC
ncbi:DUF2971 domain-containing protein [Pseudomonas sp. PB106]|uniref:DUF2971 domain-containing protein n=1 Tax=Pseudomonas sp. PB106 TaxID=2494699 RepID=UPI00131CEAB0|nr:DUF2971 domain-containing protein [Pseudomonas sp. PB106]KAE9641955.1 DUF2971 domain-containing protein [Pseudomonas sp. PB106]